MLAREVLEKPEKTRKTKKKQEKTLTKSKETLRFSCFAAEGMEKQAPTGERGGKAQKFGGDAGAVSAGAVMSHHPEEVPYYTHVTCQCPPTHLTCVVPNMVVCVSGEQQQGDEDVRRMAACEAAAVRRLHQTGGEGGGGVTPGKNGPHKVFLRHTQLCARLHETFHSEHKVTSLAGTLQSKICLFDDTGEDVCYVESKKSQEHALTAAHKVDEILAECSQRLRENDGHDQDLEAALSQRWLSDIVRYLGEHGGSQGVTISSLGGKAPRPVELKVKLGRLLVSEEAVRAGVSVTGTSPSSVVSLKQPQYELQRILMDILRISGGEMSASDLCSRLYQQSNVARDHVREEYGSFKAFLTTTALKDEVDFVQDQGCGKVVFKTPHKAAEAAAKVAAAVRTGPAGSSGGAGSVLQKVPKFDEFQVGVSLFTENLPTAGEGVTGGGGMGGGGTGGVGGAGRGLCSGDAGGSGGAAGNSNVADEIQSLCAICRQCGKLDAGDFDTVDALFYCNTCWDTYEKRVGEESSGTAQTAAAAPTHGATATAQALDGSREILPQAPAAAKRVAPKAPPPPAAAANSGKNNKDKGQNTAAGAAAAVGIRKRNL